MSMQQGAGFRICGCLVRKWAAQSGKVAGMTMDVFVDGKGAKISVKTFDCVNDFADLAAGALVEVTGRISMERLTDKAGAEVKVDGFNVWVPSLVVKTVKRESSGRAPANSVPTSGTPAERSRQLQEQNPPNPAGDQSDPSNW